MRNGAGRSHFTVMLCPPCYVLGGGQGVSAFQHTDRTADTSPGWSNKRTTVYACGHSRCSPSTRRAVTEKASSPTHFWLARNNSVCLSTDTDSSSPHPSSSLQRGGMKKASLHPGGRTLCPALGVVGTGNQEHRDLWLHQSWSGVGEGGNTNQKNSKTHLRSKKVSRKKAQGLS